MLSKNRVRWLALLYLLFLFYVVFFQGERHQSLPLSERINVMPIKNWIRFYQTNPHVPRFYFIFFSETMGNILLFMPFGFLFKLIYPLASTGAALLYGLLLSVGIELTQLFLRVGICDVNDVLLNVSGVAAGLFVFDRIKKHDKNKREIY